MKPITRWQAYLMLARGLVGVAILIAVFVLTAGLVRGGW